MNEIEYHKLSAPVDLDAMRAKLSPERRNAAEAMSLHMRLAYILRDTIAERDQSAYRRTRRAYRRTACRIVRRYKAVQPSTTIKLESLLNAPTMPRQKSTTPQQRAA